MGLKERFRACWNAWELEPRWLRLSCWHPALETGPLALRRSQGLGSGEVDAPPDGYCEHSPSNAGRVKLGTVPWGFVPHSHWGHSGLIFPSAMEQSPLINLWSRSYLQFMCCLQIKARWWGDAACFTQKNLSVGSRGRNVGGGWGQEALLTQLTRPAGRFLYKPCVTLLLSSYFAKIFFLNFWLLNSKITFYVLWHSVPLI